MKRTFTGFALFLAVAMTVMAATYKTETIKVPSVQCGMCKQRIESALMKMKGVKSISVDVESKVATVKYDASKLTVAKIERAISNAGYDANTIKANKKALKGLSACCRPGSHQ